MKSDVERRWVFISHSSRDRDIADALRQAIENRGFECWIATRDIGPGEGFQDSIVHALRQSYAMLLIFTQNANNSQEIKKEVALAGQFLVPIIPVRAEDVIPSDAFQYELVTRQWVDSFLNWDSAITIVVNKLETLKPPPQEKAVISVGVAKHPAATGDKALTEGKTINERRPRSGLLNLRWLAATAFALPLVSAGILFSPFLSNFFGANGEDMPPDFAETEATRASAFTMQTSPTEYKAGMRYWTRVAPDRWVERYPDGTQNFMKVIKRIHLDDCDGTIVSRSEKADMEFFLPDRNCPDLSFRFRKRPKGDWVAYTHLENVQ